MSGTASSFQMTAHQVQAHSLDINCVRWHPSDATLLASASDDGSVKIWQYHPEVSLSSTISTSAFMSGTQAWYSINGYQDTDQQGHQLLPPEQVIRQNTESASV